MKTYHIYVHVILAISLIVLATVGSGCISGPDNNEEDINIPEQPGYEADQHNNVSTEAEQNNQTTLGATQAESPGSEMALPAGQTEQTSTASTPAKPVPEPAIQASALGDSKYLLEHKGGDDIDLAEIRMVLSSHGSTAIYSPLSTHKVIMGISDRMVIDVISGSFTINDIEIDVTDPQTADSSAGDTKIMLYPIDSDRMIYFVTISG
ncbi:hypothetical protein [Methanolobus psychrotolerans]|uniref:hypothetical protein n=1 Tax=Methanolobus psychrotolerans TaxID=1874706 RepID=UPI000B9199DD|nr:hypothetical protein [Methanolobus psychrotolerans]